MTLGIDPTLGVKIRAKSQYSSHSRLQQLSCTIYLLKHQNLNVCQSGDKYVWGQGVPGQDWLSAEGSEGDPVLHISLSLLCCRQSLVFLACRYIFPPPTLVLTSFPVSTRTPIVLKKAHPSHPNNLHHSDLGSKWGDILRYWERGSQCICARFRWRTVQHTTPGTKQED